MDSTVVAVFDNPGRAEEARRDLLAHGLVEDRDVSVVRQRSATVKKGPLQGIKKMFGYVPPLRERAILTIYAAPGRLRQMEQIVRSTIRKTSNCNAQPPFQPLLKIADCRRGDPAVGYAAVLQKLRWRGTRPVE